MNFIKSSIFCLLLLTPITVFSQAMIIVDKHGNGDVTTIQAGVNSVSENGTVIVNPGVYRENVVVEKNITLAGSDPQATAIYASSGNAVHFSSGSDNSQIIGFSVTSSGTNAIKVGAENIGISNNVITGGNSGVSFDRFTSNDGTSITNCVFINNTKYGINVRYGSGHSVVNSIFVNNAGNAIYLRTGDISNSYNNFWNNSDGSYGGSTSDIINGGGIISKDPEFVDIDNDYHLTSDSPCIDAGKPGLAYLDPDGTRNDMGVYGGTHAYMSGFIGPVITEIEIYPRVVEQGDTITIRATGTIK